MKPATIRHALFLWTFALLACGQGDEPSTQGSPQHETVSAELADYLQSSDVRFEIVQTNQAPQASQSSVGEPPAFCEFVYEYDGGFGEYEVVEVVETLERIASSERSAPWTYYVLSSIGPRARHSPETLTLRTTGGPLGDGRWLSVDTGFELGEEVFLFYIHARDTLNAGFATPFSHAVFRGESGRGYSSIWYFLGDPRRGEEIASLAQAVLDEFGHTLHELPYRGVGFDVSRCPPATTTVNDFEAGERTPENGTDPREVDTSTD